jgi:hypothetical protein
MEVHQNSTIVSAFISNINGRQEIDLAKYIENGRKLMSQNVDKVIFIEKKIYENYYSQDSFPKTHIVFFEKSEIYLYEYLPKITNFQIHSTHPEKDTVEFMFVQCHKTEWVRRAMDINPFSSDQFIWVDFGLYHVIRNDSQFKEEIENIVTKKSEKLSIASCWNPNQWFWKDIYADVAWFFAGGVFGGHTDALYKFADYTKQKCIDIIHSHKHIMWEVNIWYLVYKDHPEIFKTYPGDHNVSILKNYA